MRGGWVGGAGWVMAGILATSLPAVAAEVPALEDVIGADEGTAVPPQGDGRRTLGRLPANLGRGAVGVFNKDNLVPFLAGGVATGAASFFDDDLRDSVSDPNSGFGKALETAGAWPVSVVVAGAFAVGRLTHSRFRAMSYDLLDAAVVNLTYTELLKVTVRRERPDGSNNQSFPSGHASDAFTWATVFERHYGWKLGVPAYALAATMGYSRIVRDKHYLSDVVAGATLGYIVGRTVVRVNSQAIAQTGGEKTLSLSPIVSRHARGLRVSMAF